MYWPFGQKKSYIEIYDLFRIKSRKIALYAQAFALISWLSAALLSNNKIPDFLTTFRYLTYLLISMSFAYFAKTTDLVRFSRISALVSIAALYKSIINTAPQPEYWIFAVATSLCVAAAPLSMGVLSYSLESAIVWTILTFGYWDILFWQSDPAWAFIFFLSSFTIGILINYSFTIDRIEVFHAMKRLERTALEDPLTRLNNRRGLSIIFDTTVNQDNINDFAFLMIDIDNFKQINDNYGHATGDNVISAVAAIIERCSDQHSCSRLGGEEFGILFNGSLAEASVLAAKIGQSVANTPIAGLNVTVSIGIAALHDNDSMSSALINADIALYQAKEAGKNCYQIFSCD